MKIQERLKWVFRRLGDRLSSEPVTCWYLELSCHRGGRFGEHVTTSGAVPTGPVDRRLRRYFDRRSLTSAASGFYLFPEMERVRRGARWYGLRLAWTRIPDVNGHVRTLFEESRKVARLQTAREGWERFRWANCRLDPCCAACRMLAAVESANFEMPKDADRFGCVRVLNIGRAGRVMAVKSHGVTRTARLAEAESRSRPSTAASVFETLYEFRDGTSLTFVYVSSNQWQVRLKCGGEVDATQFDVF